MNPKTKVLQYGLGPVGNRITEYLAERNDFEIVGAIDSDPAKMGVDIGELSGLPQPLGVLIRNDPGVVLGETNPDIVVLTTTSSLKQIQPQIMEIVGHGINVVSTCEELSYPWITNPQIAREIDQAAKEQNVSVLSTGVNPGFLMDFLPVTLSGVCRDVRRIRVERIQNAQSRRIPFQRKIGVGLTVEQFYEKVREKTLRHVGMTESIQMIAARMRWVLDKTEDIVEPVIAEYGVTTADFTIEPGMAIGINQVGRGYVNGEEVITLVFKAALGVADARERIVLEGSPNIDMKIGGGVDGDIATCAICVNAIPVVICAAAGLRTMVDIESIACLR